MFGSPLSEIFCKEQNEVIASFGGLTNMVELCLTHPNAQQYIDINSNQFTSFKDMLEMKHQNGSIICATNGDHIDTRNRREIQIVYDANTKTNANKNNSNSKQIQATSSDNQRRTHIQIQTVNTVSELIVHRETIYYFQ